MIFRGAAAPLHPQPPGLLVRTGLMGRKGSAQSMPAGDMVPLGNTVPRGIVAALGPGRSLAGFTHPPCIPNSCTSQIYQGAGIIPTSGGCKKIIQPPSLSFRAKCTQALQKCSLEVDEKKKSQGKT